jgi:probable HAF family extracellular repeat protein
MKSRASAFVIIVMSVALAISVGVAQNQQSVSQVQHYTAINPGTLGGTSGTAFGINDLGWAGGVANLTGDASEHGVLWIAGSKIDMGTFGGPNSGMDFAPNDFGQAAGWAETSVPDPLGEDFCFFGTHLTCLPFVSQFGVKFKLPTLGGNNAQGVDINNLGQVVGVAETSVHDATCTAPQVLQNLPVMWQNGRVKAFPMLPGDQDGGAVANNDEGLAVGNSGDCTNVAAHAVLWQNGKAINLGSLGGAMDNAGQGINDLTEVVGFSDVTGDTTSHGFLWRNGVMSDLGTLPGDFSSSAEGINNLGQITGYSCDAEGNCRAVLWQNGTITDLNTLLPANSSLYLEFAYFINDGGEIVGQAYQQSTNEFLPFVAIPTHGSASAAASATQLNAVPKLTLPTNVAKLAQQRAGRGRPRGVLNSAPSE